MSHVPVLRFGESSIRNGPAGFTPEERDAILEQVDRILQSPMFRISKRYPALLKYVVNQTLEGRDDCLKERILGVEVFGRTPNYDTNVDHVVRTAAGEVRKRLAQYYVEQGRADSLRIEVPAGSYVPQFKKVSEQPAVLTIAEPSANEAAPSRAPSPVKNLRWLLLASLAANLLLCVALAAGNRIAELVRGESTLEKFWDPVFQTASPVLFCVGIRDLPGDSPENASPQPNDASPAWSQEPLMRRVAMADLLTLSRLSSYAGEHHAPYRILNPATTSFADLRATPTVLIGVGNNNWTKQFAEKLRFTYVVTNHPVAIHDRQNPSRGDWLAPSMQHSDTYTDYAIVSRLVDPRIEQEIVLIGGLGPHGTEAAGEFVTSAAHMRKLNQYTPAGWAKRNVQIVLSTEVVKGSSGPPKIEATWFW